MKQRFLPWLILVACAVALGHYAYRTWRPAPESEYRIGGILQPLLYPVEPDPGQAYKHLYLRRTWHLTRPLDQAWLQVLGNDQLEVYVNGKKVQRTGRPGVGRHAGAIVDFAPLLHAGRNVIAIHAAQRIVDRTPVVAVAGEYVQPDGQAVSLKDAQHWRAATVYERRGSFWYEEEFEDQHWVAPRVGEPQEMWAQVAVPPAAVSSARRAQWISPAGSADGIASFAHQFEIRQAPAHGWLRVLTNGPYRLAVNGWIVADDREYLAQGMPFKTAERTFDLSPVLQAGRNTVSFCVTTPGEAPRLRADLGVTDGLGASAYVPSGKSWLSKAGAASDWRDPQVADDAGWLPSQPETGFLGITPWGFRRELRALQTSEIHGAARTLEWISVVAVVGMLAWFGTSLTAALVRKTTRGLEAPGATDFVYLALVPSTLVAAVAIFAAQDASFTPSDVYHSTWFLGCALLVVMQWLFIVAMPAWGRSLGTRPEQFPRWRHWTAGLATAIALLALVCLGTWLRTQHVLDEPLHHDEVGGLMLTQSVLDTGLPGGQAHPDLPYGYCATSELAYYPTALAALFFDEPRLILRVPAIFWSMATMVLIFFMGRRLFGVPTGLLAALLFAVASHPVGISNLGRYLSQLQFFALLTVWTAYEAVRGVGPINVRMMWCTAISMIAMYLSWEGSGMLGVALAAASLFHRRRHLKPLLTNPHTYLAAGVVILVVLGQNAHRITQQTERLFYGQGISDLSIKPMWRYPFFEAKFYLMQTSWIRSALLPMAGIAGAALLAIKHPLRYPIRFLLITLLVNAGMMDALLPLRANRYSYHLVPLTILLGSVTLWCCTDALLSTARRMGLPVLHRFYVRCVAVAACLVGAVLASGYAIHPADLPAFASRGYDIDQLKFPDWDGPMQLLASQMREGDVVIASHPHIARYIMQRDGGVDEDWNVDYWLESKLIIQATLGDRHETPLDRRSGAVMIPDLESLEHVFAKHDRVWYLTNRFGQSASNTRLVSKYLREHMDVVYEDFTTALMLRGGNNRTAPQRMEEEEAGRMAGDFYLR